jgi:hypothetical protein
MNTNASMRFLATIVIAGLAGNAYADGSPQRDMSFKPVAVSHCASDETVVFSCAVKGQKIVSVCATKDLSDKSGSMIYRFGRKSRPELILPKRSDNWRDTVRAGNVMYAGGGGTYLGFSSGEYTYVVYGATGRGWGSKNGLMVMKGEEEFRVHRCTKEPYFKLTHDLFKKAGLPIEDNKIELPTP